MSEPPDPLTTQRLIGLAQAGDPQALDELIARFRPRLSRWASGRLPPWARGLCDTQDLVQETLLHTLSRLDGFEPRHEGALQAYLRQAVRNRIVDEIRRVRRRGEHDALDSRIEDDAPSPLEAAIGSEAADRYEAALQRLRPEEREAIIARIEMGMTYQEMATALDKPSADAARKAAERALLRLTAEMRDDRRR